MESASQRSSAPLVGSDTLIEIVSYVGAAISLAAAGIVLDGRTDTPVRFIADAVLVAVLLGTGWAVGAHSSTFRRMNGVFLLLSALAFFELVSLFVGQMLGRQGTGPSFAKGVLVSAFALALWAVTKRSLQLVAVFFAIYYTVAVLVAPGSVNLFFGVPNLDRIAFVTWIYGWVWVLLSSRSIVEPRRTGAVLGSIAAIGGPLLFSDSRVLGDLLAIASAVVVVVLGEVDGDRAVGGVGVAGTLFAASVLIGEHVHSQGAAVLVLLLGLVLMGGAAAAARGGMGRGVPIVPGSGMPPPAPPAPEPPAPEPPAPEPPSHGG